MLDEYLPPQTAEKVWTLIQQDQVQFRISKPRKSKLGDYRPPHGSKGHRISVNADLNRFSFLITVLHEFAHLYAWKKHRSTIKPHGDEWKKEFQEILNPYLDSNVFPSEIKRALVSYISNPAASSCADENLMRALSTYDHVQKTLVEDLPEGATFVLSNGLMFTKGLKLRKRYKCLCITNKRWYYVSSTADVKIIIPETSNT